MIGRDALNFQGTIGLATPPDPEPKLRRRTWNTAPREPFSFALLDERKSVISTSTRMSNEPSVIATSGALVRYYAVFDANNDVVRMGHITPPITVMPHDHITVKLGQDAVDFTKSPFLNDQVDVAGITRHRSARY